MAAHKKRKSLNPPQVLALLLISVILIGTLLLKLPVATTQPISWMTALFTATSATTVTGLFTVGSTDLFTPFGDIIILIIIQLGGLGIMTFAVLIFLLVERSISIKQRLMIQEALNQNSLGGIVKLAKRLLMFSLFFEGFMAILLGFRLIPEWGWGKGMSYAIFHAISAFNNAGYSLWPDSLTRYAGDPVINLLFSASIMIGGLGFTVLNDVWDKKKWRAYRLHTKVMLLGTVILNAIAMVLIFLLEYDNPLTLGHLPLHDKVWTAFFQATTTRTAGFNTVPIQDLRPETLFLMMILMFIGAGSVSTSGGIKLTTAVCLMMMVVAYVRKQKEPTLMRRSIHHDDIFKALTITILAIGMIFTAIFILLISERSSFTFLQIGFEVVSAFGTVGLSTGITPELSPVGQWVIILVMIFGKLGPLTMVFSIASRTRDDIRYPSGKLFIG
ncbi:ktr system potassium uptake protein B [Pullulanibacillus camelliae]|uniref:Ktr system potassium uptake protein B n=1 Tax=Pullulanibacillus camelliae TaxID=1707096 RepID=A0A8J3DWQ7_9BACL|nr:TrkH family potassium uptake protein [Pullulanibacillus camelliae]GGE50133.1 ktr system potassium uptake protein B [Pullulanibacillus camelliae]